VNEAINRANHTSPQKGIFYASIFDDKQKEENEEGFQEVKRYKVSWNF